MAKKKPSREQSPMATPIITCPNSACGATYAAARRCTRCGRFTPLALSLTLQSKLSPGRYKSLLERVEEMLKQMSPAEIEVWMAASLWHGNRGRRVVHGGAGSPKMSTLPYKPLVDLDDGFGPLEDLDALFGRIKDLDVNEC
jgi:hypothetical protein